MSGVNSLLRDRHTLNAHRFRVENKVYGGVFLIFREKIYHDLNLLKVCMFNVKYKTSSVQFIECHFKLKVFQLYFYEIQSPPIIHCLPAQYNNLHV